MAPAPDAPLFGPERSVARLPPRSTSLIAWSLLALILVAGLAGLTVRMLVAGIAAAGRRLTESELVRLFASEMALSRPDAALERGLSEQLPYFQQLFWAASVPALISTLTFVALMLAMKRQAPAPAASPAPIAH